MLPAPIKLGPGYQVPYAEAVKQEVGIPTIAVGLITKDELAQEILSNGRADFVALGRELLRNPYWVLKAQAKEEIWPWQYHRAMPAARIGRRFRFCCRVLESGSSPPAIAHR